MRRVAIVGLAGVGLAGLVLAGCGTAKDERAVSGAGIGAATGAVVGAVTGISVAGGAALGAIGGGLAGALTGPEQIDLGAPVWKRAGIDRSDSETKTARAAAPKPRPRPADAPTAAERRVVRAIQAGLADLGYAPGPRDGIAGPRTRHAILAYQRDHGLPADAQPTRYLAAHIEAQRELTLEARRKEAAEPAYQ